MASTRNISRNDIFSIRIPHDMKMRIDEISMISGESASSVIKACVLYMFNNIFDNDGYICKKEILSGRHKVDVKRCWSLALDVSRAYGIKYHTICDWAKKGKVKSFLIKRRLYINIESIEELLNGKRKCK